MMRALYDWIVDNSLTPYILVKGAGALDVPEQFIREDEVTLNIAPRAVKGLTIGSSVVTFSARFSGVSREIYVPIAQIAAIYANENGRGMMFEDQSDSDPLPPVDESPSSVASKRARPQLRIVK